MRIKSVFCHILFDYAQGELELVILVHWILSNYLKMKKHHPLLANLGRQHSFTMVSMCYNQCHPLLANLCYNQCHPLLASLDRQRSLTMVST